MRWLHNFAFSDQLTARTLLDAVRIANDSVIRAALQGELACSVDYKRPAAFYPVRDIADFVGVNNLEWPIAFEDFDPTSGLLAAPGSEALAANILRNFARTQDDVLGPDSTLEDLRTARCNSVIFVEDYAGSGDQCLDYAESWFGNRTVRSWMSRGWIDFHVLLFAASADAKARIASDDRFKTVTVIEQAPSITHAGWSAQIQRDVRALCLEYAADKRDAFGYRKSGGLFATQHTVPDNMPSLLWQDRGPSATGDPWEPLMPNRTMPADLLTYGSINHDPILDYATVAAYLGSSVLTKKIEQSRSPQIKRLLLILALCADGVRQIPRLQAAVGIRRTKEIEAALRDMRHWGLLDDQLRPTNRGHAELARQTRRSWQTVVALETGSEPYYPQQLRGVEDF